MQTYFIYFKISETKARTFVYRGLFQRLFKKNDINHSLFACSYFWVAECVSPRMFSVDTKSWQRLWIITPLQLFQSATLMFLLTLLGCTEGNRAPYTHMLNTQPLRFAHTHTHSMGRKYSLWRGEESGREGAVTESDSDQGWKSSVMWRAGCCLYCCDMRSSVARGWLETCLLLVLYLGESGWWIMCWVTFVLTEAL